MFRHNGDDGITLEKVAEDMGTDVWLRSRGNDILIRCRKFDGTKVCSGKLNNLKILIVVIRQGEKD